MATEEQNKEVLEAVLDGIGRRGSPAGALTLLRSTNHLSPEIRRTVAAYLPSVVSKESGDRITDSLINLSQDDDEDVRDWATTGLGTQLIYSDIEDRARTSVTLIDALERRTMDDSPVVRGEALTGLARRHLATAVPLIRSELEGFSVSRKRSRLPQSPQTRLSVRHFKR